MGRGAGTGKGSYADGFTFGGTTPGGKTYWIKKGGDPRIGYIDDPTREGQQPGTLGYPIAYIDYYWKNPNAPSEITLKTRMEQSTRELTVTAATGRIPLIYGRARIGGGVLAWRGIGPYVYLSLGMCHGPISGFVSVRLMDQAASLVGGAPFGADALFQTEVGLANPVGAVPSYYSSATSGQGVERFPYLATAHGRYNVFLRPEIHKNPLFTIDGRLLRDPRLGVDVDGIPDQPEAFSHNLMCAIADYHTSPIYGPGYGDDDLYWDSVADVADYCDVLVAGLPRHTINWAIMKDGVSHRSVIDAMMSMGRIRRFRRDGKFVFAARKITSRAGVFTPHNSLPVEAEKVPMTTAPNILKGTFTNPLKDYKLDSAEPAMTAAALARTEPQIVAEMSWDGMDNASECRREEVFHLGEMRTDLRFTFDGTTADAAKYEPMDRVGYFSNTASLGVSEADPQDGWIERTQIRANGVVRFYLTKYDEAHMTDATQVTEASPVNTTVPPTDPPDAPTSPAAAASLTIGDGFTAFYPGRVLVDWTHPGWPYALKYRVTRETVDDPETTVVELESGPVFVDLKTALTTIRVYAFVVATGAISAAVAGTVAAQSAPEITNGDVNGGISTTATISWDAPKERSTTLYATSFWSSVSLVSYDGTKVNDGLTSATAFTTPAGTSRLKHDAGASGKLFREIAIYGLESGGINGGAQIQYSTDDAAWTSVTLQFASEVTDMGGGVYRSTYAWADPGAAKRYWRINFSATSNTIREVHFSEYGAEFADISEYRVYDVRGGARDLAFPPISPAAIPTSATPLNVENVTTRVERTWNVAGSMAYELLVVVVNSAGVESDGAYFVAIATAAALGGSAPYVPQTSNVLTLANGLNSDVVLSAGPGLQAIDGPTGAFSLGGIVPNGAEWVPLHYSGTQTLTIVNEDASSTAANRILTGTGANVVLVGPFDLMLWPDVAAERWVVASYRDTTIRQSAGNVSITGSVTSSAFFQLNIPNSGSAGYALRNAAGTAHWWMYENTGAAGEQGSLFVRDMAAGVTLMEFGAAGQVSFPLSDKRTTSTFSKTSDTTLANITGLTVNLKAGETYYFEATLYTTSGTVGGVKFAMAGTVTATAIVYEALVHAGAAVVAQTRSAALAGAVGGVAGAGVTAATCAIKGTITVNAAGTLTVQFAQNSSSGTASTVVIGSVLRVRKVQ